jgi:hypothetical protein
VAVPRPGGGLIDRSDTVWNIISRKPLTLEPLRRSKKGRRRGLTIEYTLIVLMIAFAAFQVLLTL